MWKLFDRIRRTPVDTIALGDLAPAAASVAPGQADASAAATAAEIHRILGRSLHVRALDSGSCNAEEWELSHLLNPIYDIQRFGIDFVASPRHADMLLVTGGVTRHLEYALRRTYAAMGEPRLVVAIGDDACTGGIIGQTYALHGGVDKIVPVTAYVPGDPPKPDAILRGILAAIGRSNDRRLAAGGGR